MKLTHLCIVALACFYIVALANGAGISDLDKEDPVRRRWEEYKLEHNKQYSGEEEENSRFELFMQRLRDVNKHNAESADMKVGVNHLSDRTPDELKQMNGLRVPNSIKRVSPQELGLIDDDDEPPAALNWAEKGNIVGPVKNQGQCGSCWAFSTTGMLEGQERLNSTGNLIQLSEQQLVDCDRKHDDNGCSGGIMSEALSYIKEVGGVQEGKDYPYKSGGGRDSYRCHFDKTKAFVTTRRLKDPKVLELKHEDELKKVLAKYGPISIGMDASLPSFQIYKSGVYHDKKCSSKEIDHAVLLVGYGTTEKGVDYWIVKNSWSVAWGQKGYFWLARNQNNHCGILTVPTLSIAETD